MHGYRLKLIFLASGFSFKALKNQLRHRRLRPAQLVLYMRLNGIVPPASRPNPPELKD